MAFDAGMIACTVHEITSIAQGGRIEKIYQPEKDEIIIQMRTLNKGKRLLINAGANYPRIGFTSAQKENPMQAPMFCMLLRKHLTGSTLSVIRQEGFERVITLGFDARDEMGYECKKYLIVEIMGKYSNIIFTDGNLKVISALKTIDFTTSSLRQILPGVKYELPPSQDKLNPLLENRNNFISLYRSFGDDRKAEKFITAGYMGIATSTAREIVYRASNNINASISECNGDDLWVEFDKVMECIRNNKYTPCVVADGNLPIEYSFVYLTHYGKPMTIVHYDSPGDLMDEYFRSRDREVRVKQRAADIMHLLSVTESRISKKIDLQKQELADCENGGKYKKYGDLITSNMYMLKRGQTTVELIDYEDWDEEKQDYGKVIIELDNRLSPTANAQKYYKKYNKAKTAKIELSHQIELAKSELEYIYSVFEALSKAETTADLDEIRNELYRSGYASKMKGYTAPKKQQNVVVAQFLTTNGYKVYCGKNNTQNEYITHKLAKKEDWWFHAKGVPGSHVLLICDGEEPPKEDFTDACEIAAYYSKAYGNGGSALIAVDYLHAKGVKKVPGSKPGFVIYHNNWSAYVTPNEKKIQSMRIK